MKTTLSKTLWIAGFSVFCLSACQTPTTGPTERLKADQPRVSVSSGNVDLTLNKSTVYSWHFGRNAQNQAYLLIVLNNTTMSNLSKPLSENYQLWLKMGSQTFSNAGPIQGGFLVLSPLPADWDEKQIAQLLN